MTFVGTAQDTEPILLFRTLRYRHFCHRYNLLPTCLPNINMQYVARRRTSYLTKTLPFLSLLHSVLLEPDGIDINEASCITS